MKSPTFEPALGSRVALQQRSSYTSDAAASLHVYASPLPHPDQGQLEVWYSTSNAERPWQAIAFEPLHDFAAAGTAKVPLHAPQTRFTYRLRSLKGQVVEWYGSPHSDVIVQLDQVDSTATTAEDVMSLEQGIQADTDDQGITRFSFVSGAEPMQRAFAHIERTQQVIALEHTLPTWHTTRLCQANHLSTQYTSPLLLLRLSTSTASSFETVADSVVQTAGSLLILLAVTTSACQTSLLGGHTSHHDVASLQLRSKPGAHAQAEAQSVVLAALCAPSELHATLTKVLRTARAELTSSQATSWLARAAANHALRASISESFNDSGCALSDDKPSEHSGVEEDEDFINDEEISPSSPSAASFSSSQPLPVASTPPRARHATSLEASRGLVLCTWEALSHRPPKLSHVLSALSNMEARAPGACTALLLDDGWAVYERKGQHCTRGALATLDLDPALIHDDAPEDRSYLQHYIESVKSRFPLVKDFGVWLTLIGHWDGLSSTLAEAYGPVVRASIEGPNGRRSVTLPSIERLATFWNDVLRSLADSGVTFIKLDAQSELESLRFEASREVGGEIAYVERAHLAFEQAASHFLGQGAVLHCMAMGSASIASVRLLAGQGAQWRATDDIVPGHAEAGRWLLTHAARVSLLFAACQGVTPDADMLCSTGQVGQVEAYAQAAFRALYSNARIFISDGKMPEHEGDALLPLLAPCRASGGALGPLRTLQVAQSSKILPSSIWRDVNGSQATAPLSISNSWSLGKAAAAVLGTWNVSNNALLRTSLRVRDVTDALDSSATGDVVICSSQSNSAAFISHAALQASTTSARLATPALLPLTLGAQECATFSIAPLLALDYYASISATCLGLSDKYAGQSAVLSLSTTPSPAAAKPRSGTTVMTLPSASTLFVGFALLALHALLSLRILPRFIHHAARFVMERVERNASPAARRLASVDVRALAKARVRPGQLRIQARVERPRELALRARIQRAGMARFVLLFDEERESISGKWNVAIDGILLGASCVHEEHLSLANAQGKTAKVISVDMEKSTRGVRWSDDQQQTLDEGEGECWVVQLWRS